MVGFTVGFVVGDSVGVSVGPSVGPSVGSLVGLAEGSSVGLAEGSLSIWSSQTMVCNRLGNKFGHCTELTSSYLPLTAVGRQEGDFWKYKEVS